MAPCSAAIPSPSARRHQSSFDFFHVLALSSCAFSLASIIFLVISIPMLYIQVEEGRTMIATKSQQFRENSNRIWPTILEGKGGNGNGHRVERSLLQAGGICQGCKPLTCPSGPSGLPGQMGSDGEPGTSGDQGPAGDDGLDIELGPEVDQACNVCPAGPPGMRGNQGERGQMGQSGVSGGGGEPGRNGGHGPEGARGYPGKAGRNGQIGLRGPQGDMVVAGVGQKGPPGPAGPAGMVGPMGMPGKPRMGQGQPGGQGPTGPEGPAGQSGKQGKPGEAGMPGEPGQPAMFCPADCGVTEIKVPGFGPGHIEEPKKGINHPPSTSPYEENGKKANEAKRRKKKAHLGIEEGYYDNDQQQGMSRSHQGKSIRRHPTGGYYWQK